MVKEYLYAKSGLYCCDIVTFNTIALRGAINDVCRGLYADRDDINYMALSDKIIELAESNEESARKKYKEVFKYVDLVNGCVVSVGNHPAGCVVSPFPVDEWFGTFTSTSDEYPISLLNMKEIDSLNFIKLDILGLDNIGLIYKTCDLAGIPFLTPDNTPADDMDVWRSIRDDTTMIFQWESNSASVYLRQLMSDETIQSIRQQNSEFSYMDLLSIGNGAIRPAGESYRDKLAQGIYQDNGHAALNNFLSPTLGYLVYQEQVMEFLHLFCGYTMGEADIVRRGFAKKTGTEKFIPDIKAGFIKTMKEKHGVERNEAEKLIVNFIKVIEDASSYLFSKNHSDPYSWIGYICGYLRYHYPIEFITTALNIFADKEDKSLAIINYAKKVGIRISPIKFRHSIARYNFNRESNEIYKGIASIKYMNSQVADEMYALRNGMYHSFMHLLFDLAEKTTLNSRQLKILIELDFFEEFGDANYLMAQYEVFDALNGKKQFRKEVMDQMGVPLDLIRRFATKETEKMFTGVNVRGMLLESVGCIRYTPRRIADKLKSQMEHLGYLDIVGDQYAGMLVVMETNTKFAPRIKAYSLKNGGILEFKIDRRTYNQQKLAVGDLIRVQSSKPKPKLRRLESGDFEPVPGVFERWITKYTKMESI